MTKKKIPIYYHYHYEYRIQPIFGNNYYEYPEYNDRPIIRKRRSEPKISGENPYPYFIDCCATIFDYEWRIIGKVSREYIDNWHSASDEAIDKYYNEHPDVEKFGEELDALFSMCIEDYLYKKWPKQGPFNDIYQCQREAEKQKVLKKYRN